MNDGHEEGGGRWQSGGPGRDLVLLHDALVAQLPDALIVTDAEGRVTAWNPAAETLYGWRAEEALGRVLGELMVPEEEAERTGALLAEVESSGAWSGELVVCDRSGRRFPAWTRLVLARAAAGAPLGYIGIFRDVGEGDRTRQALQQRTRQQAAVARLAGTAIGPANLDELFEETVAVVAETLQSQQVELLVASDGGQRLRRRAVHGDGKAEHNRRAVKVTPDSPEARALATGRLERVPGEDDGGPGVLVPIAEAGVTFGLLSVRGRRAEDEDAVTFLRSVVGLLSGAVQQRRLVDELAHRAQHDALTDLPNRILFEDRLAHALRRARRVREQVAVLFVDLDRFKTINDTLGHHAGDELLRGVARRLEANTRASDTVARLGGDEFVIMLTPVREPSDLATVTQKLLHAFDQPFTVGRREMLVRATIGVCRYPDDGDDVATLLRNADVAMYEGKLEGRNTVHFFTPELSRQVQERLQLETDLRRAPAQGELQLLYQPQHDLVSGRVTGTEALLRWAHPERGLLTPQQFVPVAEEAGLMPAIGRWVLRTALEQQRAWRDAGVADRRIAVNVSRSELAQAGFVAAVQEQLVATGVPPHELELEVTEAAVLHDFEAAAEKLAALRAAGVRVALDDFGTGYASLANLLRLPLDRLKIDDSFVHRLGVGGSAESESSVRMIAALARDLSLEVVVEGLETQGQLGIARDVGCLSGQGYLFGRPLPGAELGFRGT